MTLPWGRLRSLVESIEQSPVADHVRADEARQDDEHAGDYDHKPDPE